MVDQMLLMFVTVNTVGLQIQHFCMPGGGPYVHRIAVVEQMLLMFVNTVGLQSGSTTPWLFACQPLGTIQVNIPWVKVILLHTHDTGGYRNVCGG